VHAQIAIRIQILLSGAYHQVPVCVTAGSHMSQVKMGESVQDVSQANTRL